TEALAEAISRLVIRYPSEGSDPADGRSGIEDPIEDEALPRDWRHEKRRIRNLVSWPDVAERHGFPAGSTVHHLHPVGFIENFYGRSCFCDRDLTADEVRSIVLGMRESEPAVLRESGDRLFDATNISLPEAEKTYELLTDELNAT